MGGMWNEKNKVAGPAADAARKLRREMTDAERKLWWKLRGRQMDGFKFRRQVPIGRYVADFACMEAKLIVEVDGGQHADDPSGDIERTRCLEGVGYRVLRFWNHDVLKDTDAVCLAIAEALRGLPPTQPSPSRGEGFAPRGGPQRG